MIFRFSADNLKLSTDRKTWVQKGHSVILPSNPSDLFNTVLIQIDIQKDNIHLTLPSIKTNTHITDVEDIIST